MTTQKNINNALIVIDVQNDFCSCGSLAVGEDNSFISNINSLINDYETVIFTQEWHPTNHISFAENHPNKKVYDKIDTSYGTQILWPKHCVENSHGADFHPSLKTEKATLVLHKGMQADCETYSAFSDTKGNYTGLAGFLHERGIEKLTFSGLTTDFCVAASALDAVALGFQTRVALAACQALDINGSYDHAMTSMQQHGVELSLFN